MYGSVCDGMDMPIVHPELCPTAESVLIRKHIRKILRKLSRLKADTQYS
ncbi:hypothetical protein [Methylobacterium sp. P5_C11]